MTDQIEQAGADARRRFLFEDMDLRGEWVQLEKVLDEVRAIHAYPQPVARLLGEFLAAAVLLAGTLKFRGTLTVQARSERALPLIMAECSSQLEVRAIARGAQGAVGEAFDELLGDGQLVMTVTPEKGRRYQGIVPLQGPSLAASLDRYFAQSEQLQTALFIACDGRRAAGILLQQLPMARETDPLRRQQHWEHVQQLAATLRDDELLALDAETLLQRLYHAETLRLFEGESVRFHCSCSRERSLAALATLGDDEIQRLLAEQGVITMDCEFCNQRYVFEPDAFAPAGGPGGDQTIH
jgi:molecular chaperone Hsp33